MGVGVRWSVAIAAYAMLAAPLAAQTDFGSISGRVIDSTSRQGVVGASVIVVGTQVGAMTRDDGSYTIARAPAGAQRVRATRIGFRSVERDVTVPANEIATVDIVMPSMVTLLTGVVTIGYGTQRREAITGSVATVDASEALVGVITNANQLLQGRVAGLNIVTNNGEPGGGVQIRVRGGTSLGASNDPLYVIDGVPLQNETPVAGAREVGGIRPALARSPLNTINPNDIESITVLKDASATAIYGSRGANGVILIETKRGTGTTSFTYETYASASTAAAKLDLLTGNEYRQYVQEQVDAGTLNASRLDNLGDANTDWEDELTRTGHAVSHNLSFSGGSPETRYFASLNYFDQAGVVLSNGLKRYQGRFNGQTVTLNDRLALGVNLTAARVDNDYLPFENTGGFEGGVFTNMAIFNPTRSVMVVDPATGEDRYYEIGTGPQSVRNPVALAEQVEDEAGESRVLGNVTATLTLMPGLTTQTTLGADYTDALRRTYFPRANAIGAAFNGLARQAQRNLQTLNLQQLVTYAPDIGERHEVEVVGGYEYTKTSNTGFEVIAQGFITDAFRWNNLGAGTQSAAPPPVSYRQDSRLASFLSRVNYGLNGKYFLTGVMRYDGSSRLAEGNQWSLFPALSASWRISEEDFMSGQPMNLSTLSVRAGWGLQGNQSVRPYATQLLFRADEGARYPFGTTVYTGLVAAQVANPDLGWEKTEQVNLGIDYGFADNRFTGVLDLYQKTTTDLLLEVSVPQPAVVSTRFENIGSIRNRGFEATLDAELWSMPSRTLSAGLIASVERTKVIDLGGRTIATGGVSGQGQSGRNAQRLIEGEPVGVFWGPRFLSTDEDGRQLFACATVRPACVDGETTTPLGDDEEIIGNANPDFSLGFRNNLTLGNFDASWLWRGEFGGDVFNNTALVYGSKSNVLNDRNFLRSALGDDIALGEPAIYSSLWIEDGSFVRLQNMTLGYTFDLPTRLGTGKATRVYVSGDNLLLFSDYSGYDPEVFIGAGLAARGMDYLTYPRARTFTLGARVQF